LNAETFPKVLTVVDSSIATSSSIFAVHALSSGSTVFLSGTDVLTYLRKLETDEVKIQELDFQSLTSAPVAAAAQTSKAPVKEKEDAKIEGAVQIAIGVKKDVDFAAWYTNVSASFLPIGQYSNIVSTRSSSRPTCSTTTASAVAIFLSLGHTAFGKRSKVCENQYDGQVIFR
jgi:hypothetical protein